MDAILAGASFVIKDKPTGEIKSSPIVWNKIARTIHPEENLPDDTEVTTERIKKPQAKVINAEQNLVTLETWIPEASNFLQAQEIPNENKITK